MYPLFLLYKSGARRLSKLSCLHVILLRHLARQAAKAARAIRDLCSLVVLAHAGMRIYQAIQNGGLLWGKLSG